MHINILETTRQKFGHCRLSIFPFVPMTTDIDVSHEGTKNYDLTLKRITEETITLLYIKHFQNGYLLKENTVHKPPDLALDLLTSQTTQCAALRAGSG